MKGNGTLTSVVPQQQPQQPTAIDSAPQTQTAHAFQPGTHIPVRDHPIHTPRTEAQVHRSSCCGCCVWRRYLSRCTCPKTCVVRKHPNAETSQPITLGAPPQWWSHLWHDGCAHQDQILACRELVVKVDGEHGRGSVHRLPKLFHGGEDARERLVHRHLWEVGHQYREVLRARHLEDKGRAACTHDSAHTAHTCADSSAVISLRPPLLCRTWVHAHGTVHRTKPREKSSQAALPVLGWDGVGWAGLLLALAAGSAAQLLELLFRQHGADPLAVVVVSHLPDLLHSLPRDLGELHSDAAAR
jgi:hypothetical protein